MQAQLSPDIDALWENGDIVTDNAGIERILHTFAKKMGAPPTVTADFSDDPTFPLNKNLNTMMDIPTINEVRATLAGSADAAASGTLPTCLLKAATFGKWVYNIPEDSPDSESHSLASKFFTAHAPPPSNTNDKSEKPNSLALLLLRRIFKASILSKSIPQSQKLSVITGLPKERTKGNYTEGTGHLNSTDLMRPISVGPIIGKLINSMMAARLGKLLVKHNVLN